MSYPVPENESERLQALQEYAVLDTPQEQVFDDFTYLASRICDVPIALISLVDKDRQWFKSRVGIAASETPRELAFCAHTILQHEIMVVPDATVDRRFSDNVLVTSEPAIRFYAGAPLVSAAGLAIGTLCAIDRVPRELSREQGLALQALARQVMARLELQRVSRNLAEAFEKIKVMSGMIPICSYCKSIRDDQGFWESLEQYLDDHADVELTHGICDSCMEKHFPEHSDAPGVNYSI